MNIFKILGNISYKDIIQLDGAFSINHLNYKKYPKFHNNSGKNILKISQKSLDKIEDYTKDFECFNGTEKNCTKNTRLTLWKNYWLEYINSFDKLVNLLPYSIVTVFIGRQAVELGFKFLLLKKTNEITKTHNLEILSKQFFFEYKINYDYFDYVYEFCDKFCKYIEGENSEYFRFPEYRENNYFAGNGTDMKWLSYNLALIILKLLHFANLENEF